MPSFLNKVFGYKKHDDKESARPTRDTSDSTLLDGKYEAIPPVVSPSSSTFTEALQIKDSERDTGFSLFKQKARAVAQKRAQKHPQDIPHLTLQLPGPKESSHSRSLGIVFEADPDSQIVLDDAVIAAKRLNPLEALILIRACAQAIIERGLDTLGIMHPHWFAASPDVQRRLISLFIRSLTQTRITTLSPTPTSSASSFENELRYTRSPHDLAAVLRWGLRHLSLESGHFGKDNAEWGWYMTFFRAERDASYPHKAFSDLLLPQLPTSHIELLTTTLTLISSLASHAEANSISGSKLSTFLGIWLLVATRAEEHDDWNRFYARWERSGRILEHLFLARLREESFEQCLPTRLQELVKHYPYNKGSPLEGDLLSRPRFSTRQYDALFVRVESLLAHNSTQPKQHPIQLLLEAFQLPVDIPSGDECVSFWNTLKSRAFEDASSSDLEGPQFSRIFVDETIHLLSLIPADNSLPRSPIFLTSPITPIVSRKRSSSFTKTLEHTIRKSSANDESTPVSPTSPSSIVVTDWAQFTLSGFAEAPVTQPLAALVSLDDDNDIEVTQPRTSRKSSRQRGKSRTRRRGSEERGPVGTSPSSNPELEPSIIGTGVASVHVVQIDEAFVDFWSDAIVDPISANWPTFVVCGLKQISSTEQPLRWLVIEQAYSRQEPSRAPSPDGRRGRSPRPSFKSDISGFRINSMLSTARKRFSAFSKSATDLDLKKSGGRTIVTGELGEILVEEEPTSGPSPKPGLHVGGNESVKATVSGGARTDIADQLKSDEISVAPSAASKDKSKSVQPVAKALSVERSTHSGGSHRSSLPVRTSEETISVEDSLPALDVDNSEVNHAFTPVSKTVPLAADASDLRSTLNRSDPTVFASAAFPSADPAIKQAQVKAEQVHDNVVCKVEDRDAEFFEQTMDYGDGLHGEPAAESSYAVHVDFADDGSREDTEFATIPPTPETVALTKATPVAQPAVAAAVSDKIPEPTVEELRVEKQPSQSASAVAFFAKSLVQYEIDDTAMAAQLEPQRMITVGYEAEEDKEVPEDVEIPTPAAERVALIEETPGQEGFTDGWGRVGAAQTFAAKAEVLDPAASRLEVPGGVANRFVAAELRTTLHSEAPPARHPVEAPYAEDFQSVGTGLQGEGTTDEVPQPAQSHVQETIATTAEETHVEGDVSAGTESDLQQAEGQSFADVETRVAFESFVHEDCAVESQDADTSESIPARGAWADKIFSREIAADTHGAVKAAPATAFKFEEAEVPGGEVRRVRTPPIVAGVLSSASTRKAAVAVAATLATADEIIAVKVETESTTDTSTEDGEANTPTLERFPFEGALGVVDDTITAKVPRSVEGRAAAPGTAEEAQVLVEDTPSIASERVAITPIVQIEESVAQDVQASKKIDRPPGESVPQFDGVANPPIVAGSVPEEISAVEVEIQVEPDAAHFWVEDETFASESERSEFSVPTPIVEGTPASAEIKVSSLVVIAASGQVATSQLDARAIVTSEIPELDGTGLAERSVTFESDVPVHESDARSEETAPV